MKLETVIFILRSLSIVNGDHNYVFGAIRLHTDITNIVVGLIN